MLAHCIVIFLCSTYTTSDAIECSSSVVDDVATVSCDLERPNLGDIFCSINSGPQVACEYLYTSSDLKQISRTVSFTLN